jgi:N-acetylneuraminic acid mutarotase
MAYAGNSKVIIFGGDRDRKEHFLNDTWEYDTISHTWTEFNKKGVKPSPRKHCVMVKVSNDKLVLFGGMTSNGKQLDDTWEYNLITHEWRLIPVFGPSARVSHAMAYIGDNKVLLFGGSVFSEKAEDELDDTWIYDVTANTWTEYEQTGPRPAARHEPAVSYSGGSKIILYGGNHIGGDRYLTYGDTWEYDLKTNTWTEYNQTGIKPPIAAASAITYDGYSTIFMHGGGGSEIADQTWEYNLLEHVWIRRY